MSVKILKHTFEHTIEHTPKDISTILLNISYIKSLLIEYTGLKDDGNNWFHLSPDALSQMLHDFGFEEVRRSMAWRVTRAHGVVGHCSVWPGGPLVCMAIHCRVWRGGAPECTAWQDTCGLNRFHLFT